MYIYMSYYTDIDVDQTCLVIPINMKTINHTAVFYMVMMAARCTGG